MMAASCFSRSSCCIGRLCIDLNICINYYKRKQDDRCAECCIDMALRVEQTAQQRTGRHSDITKEIVYANGRGPILRKMLYEQCCLHRQGQSEQETEQSDGNDQRCQRCTRRQHE